MKNLICNIGFFLLIFLRLSALSQQAYTLQRLDSRNGLSNSSVNAIFQSRDKMLWIGTWDGLNIFNGSSFKTFNYTQDPNRSIGNNVVEDITEDKYHNMWISTVEGISKYQPETGVFTHFFYNTLSKRVSEKQFILLTDKGGHPYIYSMASGLQRFDEARSSFIRMPLELPEKKVKEMLFAGNGLLWVLLENGALGSFRLSGDRMQAVTGFDVYRDVHSVHELSGQMIVTGSGGELARISDNKRIPLHHLPYAVKLIVPYQEHYIIAWEKKGCTVVDKAFMPSSFLQNELSALQESQINTIHTGSNNLLWIGTDGNGMSKIAPLRNPFTLVSNANAGLRDEKQVRAFEKVANELWVGTKGNGILAIPFPVTSNALKNRRIFSEATGLSNNAVYAIRQINDSCVYIGSDGEGITLYNIRSKTFTPWKMIKGTSQVSFRSVYAVFPDNDGTVWLGTSGYGLIHLRIEGEKPALTYFRQYTSNGSETGPASDIIFSLARDSKDRIWAGCRYGGVSIFNKSSGKFTTLRSDNKTNLSHNDILYIMADSHRQMWVGTSYGLNRINEDFEEKRFQSITTDQGLPNNTIHGIAEDSQGMIWVSTNNGLARIIRESNDVIRFSESDGLQSNEFSDGAVWKGPDGSLFFGGIYGFNFCEPSRVLINTAQPNLQVTGIQPGEKDRGADGYRVLQPDITDATPEYTLSPYHNYFDLSIKAIDFANAGKSEYAYRLDGFDKNWHFPGSSGYISYGNLPAGDYVLSVKWSNGEGQWTPEKALLSLTVEQYFWLTPPAFLLYYVLAVIFIYVVYTYRKSRSEIKHKLELEYRLRLKEEKLHAEKLDFFTNIAHELQTPLTLIMGSVEHQQDRHIQEDKKTATVLSLVRQQASRLTYLVEQLMEFRKAEEGHLHVNYQPLAASVFLSNIARLFVDFKEYNGVQYDYDIEEDIFISSDPDKIEKIIFNLLSNAFKYTSPGEKIYFNVCRSQDMGNMEILVANSGHNIPADEMRKLFGKFFTGHATRKKFSSGLGLAFTSQLVTLLNGNIQAYCKDNWACFKVELPIKKQVEAGQQFAPRSLQPSLMMRTMTQDPSPRDLLSPGANNKAALLQSLEHINKLIILVVEDEAPIRQLLRNLLSEKYIVYEAANGKEALECLTTLTPHLIMSDIMMDDMNGLELCKKVKNIPATCHIPFLLLSARGSSEQQHEGYEAGADAYLPKPFHTQHVLGRIQQLLENRKRLHDYFRGTPANGAEVPQGINEEDRKFLEKLLSVISVELDNAELDASLLEAAMCISRMQLYRKVKTISGMTPAEFIRNVRLQKAAELLENSRMTVSEIFFRTGFNNQSYFFREFRKKFQYSPNEYRASRKISY